MSNKRIACYYCADLLHLQSFYLRMMLQPKLQLVRQ